MERPYISFVIAARNDDYEGNFLHRIQIFVNVLVGLWKKHNLCAELIIVEYNPPEKKQSLQKAIAWPETLSTGNMRIIQVPGRMHKCLPNADNIPLHEYVAKNIGIRRAKGRYVLITNPDIIFTDSLIKYLASKCLLEKAFYGVAQRRQVDVIPIDMAIDKQLRLCFRDTLGINDKAVIRFIWRKILFYVKHIVKFILPSIKIKAMRFEDTDFSTPCVPYPGDFILMRRSLWHNLRGFPEFYTYSHTDICMCAIAANSGLHPIILPYWTYHQSHEMTSKNVRVGTDYNFILKEYRKMMRNKTPIIYNNSDWGFGNENLTEILL